MRRSIGRTGFDVYAVGLGALPLSNESRPSEADGIRVIHAALDSGIDFIDTANVYCLDDSERGHNERLIAKALKQWPGKHSIVVATKGGCARPQGAWTEEGSPQALRRVCEASLKALGVETIALYQLHTVDETVPIEDSVGELHRLQQEGKILHIGLSNVDAKEIDRAMAVARIETVQNRFSPVCQRDLHNGVLQKCAELGLTYIAYSPVGGGRGHNSLARHPLLVRIADNRGATPYQVMLAWALRKGDHILPIPGASKVKSATDSAAAVDVELSEEDVARIDAIELVA